MLKRKPSLVFTEDKGTACAPLHYAACRGYTAIVEVLLTCAPETASLLDKEKMTPLHHAAQGGYAEVVSMLLASGTNANSKDNEGFTPLHLAALYAHGDVVRVLLGHHADVNAKAKGWWNALHLATAPCRFDFEREELATKLLAGTDDQIARCRRILDGQPCAGRKEVVELLLANGAAVDAGEGFWEATPLQLAAERGELDIAALLITHKADIDAADSYGRTPLLIATSNRHWQLAELLIAHGANVNAKEGSGDTALQNAAANGSTHIAKLLLAKGADVNNKGHHGMTPLHWAVRERFPEMAAVLLANRADVNAVSNQGETPLDEATGQDCLPLAELLRKHGGKHGAKSTNVPPNKPAIGRVLVEQKKEPPQPVQAPKPGDQAATPYPPSQPSSEDILGGCRLLKKIGEGGFGAVYKAHHLALNIPVAVKVLISKTPGGNAPGEDRFLREARIAARLKHTNIVGVLNVGIEHGIHFIVMDFIEGKSLQVLLKEKGRLPISSAVGMFSQICQGLHYAHEQGVMHRDIKPGNILIETGGAPKIADFGFAKFADDDLSLTVSGAVMGTPYYLSPEQARDAKNVDRRADIYSLGCTFYHVVCGRVPFQGETLAQVLLAHQQASVPDPRSVNSAVPSRLGQIIMKMMAKKPTDRFESVSAVHRQLAELASDMGHRN